eukprot:6712535-Alexandrium_andersonii.AAC.1
MSASLVGSEMCIRDRGYPDALGPVPCLEASSRVSLRLAGRGHSAEGLCRCLLYTSTLPTICSV